jgi:flavin reductase (DIM6/NTAB) family NADH-FMN oxidoreductase RutF
MFHSKLNALMLSGVVPRAIALVSTISEEGIENLAPFRYDDIFFVAFV